MSKRNGLEQFLASPNGQKLFNYLYSWGAAVVIIGAMFKILHLNGANQMLMIGMITEALVFFMSGFDTSAITNKEAVDETTNQQTRNSVSAIQVHGQQNKNTQNKSNSSGNESGSNIYGDTTSSTNNPSSALPNNLRPNTGSSGSGNGGTVIIGNLGTSNASDSSGTNLPNKFSSSSAQQAVNQYDTQTHNTSSPYLSPEYNQNLAEASKNMADFAQVMGTLNEFSSTMLNAYQQMSDSSMDLTANSKNFVNNMKSLNNNIMGLNTIYESQLQSIENQIATVKYINESLEKIKKFYGESIVDSTLFREETEKMTKQIEALNQVYARLLRAMTSTGNNSGII